MSQTSATGGFLVPSVAPNFDDSLVDLVTPTVVGITGLPEDYVRPRWVAKPRNELPRTVDWCAVGVVSASGPTNSSTVHDSSGDGSSTVYKDRELTLAASFYGPNAVSNAELLEVGLEVSQNRTSLYHAGLTYVAFDRVSRVPELDNNLYINRCDAVFRIRTRRGYTYQVNNLLNAKVTLTSDAGRAGPAFSTTK